MPFFIEGQPRPETNQAQNRAPYFGITPDYFATMKIPLLRGRDFSRNDTAAGPRVVIINETLAKQFWPDEDPIGKRITFDLVPNEQPREIVGIVGDTLLQRFQRQAPPIIYVPHLQQQATWQGPSFQYRATMAYVMRTAGDPVSIVPAVRSAVAEIDPNKPAGNIRTVEQYLGDQARVMQGYTMLLSVFGISAVLLAAIGIYGVMAYAVAQRTREIGIRMALGASGGSVMRLVLRRAFVLIAVGLALGVSAALGLTRFLESQLYEVSPTDAPTFTVVTMGLVIIAVAATLIPAWRAVRVDPTVALRYE